jgi:hypothetical protein
MVDRSSLTFGRIGDEPSLFRANVSLPGPLCTVMDVNGDGLKDLVCQFDRQQAGFQLTDTMGVLRGKTITGITFVGTDSVNIVN